MYHMIDDKKILRALYLNIVRGIVDKYGGSMTVNEEEGIIDIDISDDDVSACAHELDHAVGGVHENI